MPAPISDFTGLDPRAKQHLKDRIFERLYTPVQRKFDRRIKELVIENSRAQASSQTGFMFRNEWYTYEKEKRAPRTKVRLIERLKPAMEEHLKEAHKLNTYEIPYVIGFIAKVLNSSQSKYDYLRVLPSPLHPIIQELTTEFPDTPAALSDDQVETLKAQHKTPIELIKSRLVLNLLLQ